MQYHATPRKIKYAVSKEAYDNKRGCWHETEMWQVDLRFGIRHKNVFLTIQQYVYNLNLP